jgi:CheY-like chemotaxis protein
VDDSVDSREMYAEYLRFSGFAVAEAADGREAVVEAVNLLPDLIVMDLGMPVMDGWGAISMLRRVRVTRAIPIIALSGYTLGAERTRAEAAGADLFLGRPCLPNDLVVQIRRLLQTKAA